jgi:hypothetical protein
MVFSSTNMRKHKCADGAIMINQYKVIKDLGEGAFGKV